MNRGCLYRTCLVITSTLLRPAVWHCQYKNPELKIFDFSSIMQLQRRPVVMATLQLNACVYFAGVPGELQRGADQRVRLRADWPAGLHRPRRPRLHHRQDGRTHHGERAEAQRRRHRCHGTRGGANEIRLQGQVSGTRGDTQGSVWKSLWESNEQFF